MIDGHATAQTQARYRRIAPFFDATELLAERRYRSWRPRSWSLVKGPKVLEVVDLQALDFPDAIFDDSTTVTNVTFFI
jgi:hypothetical protein